MLTPTFIVSQTFKKEHAESMIDKDWSEIDSLKVSDKSLKSLINSFSSIKIKNIIVNRYFNDKENLELQKVNVNIISDKDESSENMDIKTSSYIKCIKDNMFLKNRCELLIKNYENHFKDDYMMIRTYTLNFTPIILGGISCLSLYLFRNSIPFI